MIRGIMNESWRVRLQAFGVILGLSVIAYCVWWFAFSQEAANPFLP